MIYIILIYNIDGELEECLAFNKLQSAVGYLISWGEDNCICLDPDESDADRYCEECDFEEYEEQEYISRIIDDNSGSIEIKTLFVED